MNRTIEDICKEIDEINSENISLDNKKQVNNFKLMKLEGEIKELKDKSLEDWYKMNPLQKYYKRVDPVLYNCVDNIYINIYDDKVNEYDRNIKRMADSSLYPYLEYINIESSKQGEIERIHYNKLGQVNISQFLHGKDDNPRNHGEWTLITKEEFEEAKNKVKEFINSI